MKIATWNLERPTNTATRIHDIEKQLAALNADILILTETNDCINPGPGYKSYHTSPLVAVPADRNNHSVFSPSTKIVYKTGERRTSIYSKYDATAELETFNKVTAICIKFQTPLGELAVYGTIIGILGNREESFKTDLDLQLADFNKIAAQTNLCIAGYLNMSFGDNYYYTKESRGKLSNAFDKLQLVNMTGYIPENIDHIILPKSCIGKKKDIEVWNTGKQLSDHMGIAINIL